MLYETSNYCLGYNVHLMVSFALSICCCMLSPIIHLYNRMTHIKNFKDPQSCKEKLVIGCNLMSYQYG